MSSATAKNNRASTIKKIKFQMLKKPKPVPQDMRGMEDDPAQVMHSFIEPNFSSIQEDFRKLEINDQAELKQLFDTTVLKGLGKKIFDDEYPEVKEEFEKLTSTQKSEFTGLFLEILLDNKEERSMSGQPAFESKAPQQHMEIDDTPASDQDDG